MYELRDKERIFVFTGPDGSGRRSIADMVGSTLGIYKVIGYTTRPARPIEEEGQDYHFINRAQFQAAADNGEFLEQVEINGHWYGIKNSDIERLFQQYRHIYLILNPTGAQILKDLYGDRLTRIFIYADRRTVEERQRKKGLSEEEIARNLAHYDNDMTYMASCAHSCENLDLAHAVFDITKILDKYLDRGLLEKD